MIEEAPRKRLRQNRDFQLIWIGQVVSDLGSRVSSVAFPLLVLSLTNSPARAGLVAAAGSLPSLLFTLPAGALLDRWNRKRTMLTADGVRALALASIPVAALVDEVTVPHVVGVAFIEGSAWVFFHIAERAALKQIVLAHQLHAAVAQNQARSYAAQLAGQPLGGLLFGLGRMIPFVFDAVSYAVSFVSLLFVRAQLQEPRDTTKRHLRREIAEGLAYVWRQPFLRVTSLLVTGSDLVLNALFLVVIVIARENGASPQLVGVMLFFIGAGGIVGSAVAPWIARRMSPRTVIVSTQAAVAVLVPALLLVDEPLLIGALFGLMFVPFPAWNAVVSAYRTALVPDRLQGRVVATIHLLVGGALPVGLLLVGVGLEAIGSSTVVIVLSAIMAVVVVSAALSRAIRDVPPLETA